LFAAGLMGIEVPAEQGGSGGSFFKLMLAIEELSRIDPAVAVLAHVHNVLVVNPLMRWGTPEQKSRYLPKLAFDTVGAYSLSEVQAGSDAFALTTRAEDHGDHWLIRGQKKWTTSGREAGLFLLFASVKPELGGRGLGAFLIEADSPGLAIGKVEDKMGLRASSTCEIHLDGVKVPKDGVLGSPTGGNEVGTDALNKGRIGIAAQMVGLAQGAFEAALRYSQQRKQFGQPIGSFQAVQFTLAEMATEIEAARLLTYNVARMKDAGAPYFRLARPSSMAKLYAARIAEKVASQAIEIFGGAGYIRDNPVEKLYRDAKIGSIYEGTTNMQLRVIASALSEGG
ncbi:MAG TPA: acyl-CoA dehydrogenase family protein, partial [Thermoanaerobaculia bacterium]|nr:acyl-CoA dehydrogenase family protein [Thermoanaerobaculia bacterium]